MTELQRLAAARTASHPRRLAKNSPILEDTEIIGIIAEKVVGDFFGLPIQDYVTPGQTDPGYDFVLPNGIKIDVKGTTVPHGNLVVSCDNKFTADVYVLVIVHKDTESGIIKGYASKEELLNAPKRDFGKAKGPVYFFKAYDLHPIQWLLLT